MGLLGEPAIASALNANSKFSSAATLTPPKLRMHAVISVKSTTQR